MALHPTLNGFLMWTLSQHVQDLQEAGLSRDKAIKRVYRAAELDYVDVSWSCHAYPGRDMPDEGIFPIPPEDQRLIRKMEQRLKGE